MIFPIQSDGETCVQCIQPAMLQTLSKAIAYSSYEKGVVGTDIDKVADSAYEELAKFFGVKLQKTDSENDN